MSGQEEDLETFFPALLATLPNLTPPGTSPKAAVCRISGTDQGFRRSERAHHPRRCRRTWCGRPRTNDTNAPRRHRVITPAPFFSAQCAATTAAAAAGAEVPSPRLTLLPRRLQLAAAAAPLAARTRAL